MKYRLNYKTSIFIKAILMEPINLKILEPDAEIQKAWEIFSEQNPGSGLSPDGELPGFSINNADVTSYTQRSCMECIQHKFNISTCRPKHPETNKSVDGACPNLGEEGLCTVYRTEEYPPDCKNYFCSECTDGNMHSKC
jgi:hypothetical protein